MIDFRERFVPPPRELTKPGSPAAGNDALEALERFLGDFRAVHERRPGGARAALNRRPTWPLRAQFGRISVSLLCCLRRG